MTEPAEKFVKEPNRKLTNNTVTLPDFLTRKQEASGNRNAKNASVMSTITAPQKQPQRSHRQSIDFPAQKRLDNSNDSFRLDKNNDKMLRTQNAFFNKNSSMMTTRHYRGGGMAISPRPKIPGAVNVYAKMQRVSPQSNPMQMAMQIDE